MIIINNHNRDETEVDLTWATTLITAKTTTTITTTMVEAEVTMEVRTAEEIAILDILLRRIIRLVINIIRGEE